MRGKLGILFVCGAFLVCTSFALAASTSAPVAGGRYLGRDDSRTLNGSRNSVTLAITRNRANFASGRLNFWLNGRGGLGSCAGPAYVYLSPTRSRQITRQGSFDLRGHFTFSSATPYGPVKYLATVAIKGAFASAGRHVSGTLAETARSKALTCRSGTLTFRATLAR